MILSSIKQTKREQGWVYEGGNWTSDDWAWGGFIMSPEELVNQVVSFYNTPGSGIEKINSQGIKFVGGVEPFTLGDVSEASVAAIVQPRKSIDSLEVLCLNTFSHVPTRNQTHPQMLIKTQLL